MQYVKLNCGCKLPVVNGVLHVDYNNLNHNCLKTWKLYADGHTRSIFQLESRLCRTWAKELNPTSIKDAADLIAIVRPGTLHSEDENGRSMTNVFCKRKTGQEIYDTTSPLARLLIDTYNILVYQEQLMYISKQLAGFDGKSANKLMKSIGKKDAALLFSLETQFVEGCVKHGILNRAEAIEAFTNIKHSARYMFNKSHSYSYAMIGYQTAWVKAHFPEQYICAWLKIAKNEAKKLEEIRGMMSEARRLKIKVYGPSVRNLPESDFFIEDGAVYFGLSSIKGCSADAFQKLNESGCDFKNVNWTEFLIKYSGHLSKSRMVPMIQTGCFDDFTLKSRMQCQFEYDLWMTLTAPRRKKIALMYSGQENLAMTLNDWVEENPKDKDLLDPMINLLMKPNQSLFDSKKNLIEHEKVLLGVNITCSHVERASVPRTAVTAKDVNKSTYDRNKSFMVAGEICEYEEFKIKKGKLAGQIMANFKLDDGTDELEVVVFPSTLDEFQAALYEGNTVLVKGKRSNRGEGLILDEIYEV